MNTTLKRPRRYTQASLSKYAAQRERTEKRDRKVMTITAEQVAPNKGLVIAINGDKAARVCHEHLAAKLN